MRDIIVNPFYAIETMKSKTKGAFNQIFGIPKMRVDLWPKEGGEFLHHVITVDVRGLQLPEFIHADLITIFYQPKIQGKKSPFRAVYRKANQILDNTKAPDGYDPNWIKNKEQNVMVDGLSFEMKKINVPDNDVAEGFTNTTDSDLPKNLEKIRGSHSFVGGYPIWLQGAAFPKASKSSSWFYFMMLNGFADYFQATPFEGVDSFIFLQPDGVIESVSQT
jgi:hypothetical protein